MSRRVGKDVSLHLGVYFCFFFFSSRRRHTRSKRDWSSDVCSSDLDEGVRPTSDLYSEFLNSGHQSAISKDSVITRANGHARSEERRVGKEWRWGGWGWQ